MSPEFVIQIARQGVYTTLLIAAPILIIALGVGLLVSIFQATTQIQEQTLAFIPKIAAALLALIFFGPWMLSELLDFTYQIFTQLDQFGR
ncbi:MAG TPA: flagellar biosynthesis protein FliQ [Bacillales bacterium]|nr:flagellar biosynthesis protein FliQ [Bacillales bacterium]